MKILRIRFRNLNSLKGEWFIDLTHNIYTSEGIFAITGPTGAGKTTIFDAVCMALYGRTPRLGRLGGQNEIMTRRTCECFAEVEFETSGREYKCRWEQKKSGRKLQPVRHILSEAGDNGKIFTEKTSETTSQIEKLTGMDFKRFTQAMMLEQGRFDAFLKANSTERSEILELITDSGIYSKISTRVYERCHEEYDKREKLQLRLDDMKPRDSFGTDEEIANELAQNRSMLALIERRHEETQKAILWLREIAKLREELIQNQHDLETQDKRSEQFSELRQKLEAGLRAQDLMPEHEALKARREAFTTTKTRCDKAESEIAAFTQRITQITGHELPESQERLTQVRRGITESPETVSERVTRLVSSYKDAYNRKSSLELDRKKCESELAKAQGLLKLAQDESEKARVVHEKIVDALGKMSNLRAEEILDIARLALRPGKPCPVCGSLEHPAIKYSGVMTANIDEQIEKLRHREQISRDNCSNMNAKMTLAVNQESKARADLNNCINELSRALDEFADSRRAVLEAIEPLGIYNAKGRNEILRRLGEWSSSVRTLEQKIDALTKESEMLTSRTQTISSSLEQDRAALEALGQELKGLEASFREHLEEKGFPDEKAFMEVQLSPETLANLQERSREIDDRTKQLEAVKLDRTQKLEARLSENITDLGQQGLEALFRSQDETIKAITKRDWEIEAALDSRKKLRAELEALMTEYKAQDKIYSDWSELNELIGTRNGSKFRNFAQKVTLLMMIELANRQLEKLSGRYTLTATPGDDGLALSVIDHEQAGEVRPTANLSGGERFIVSLALALGLSQISGSKARVDSLFLDEGFGSLDEDSLNTALEALGEVRREGRMIGIISHVQALKDRIRAQISVIPKSEGVSIIEGEGCKCLTKS